MAPICGCILSAVTAAVAPRHPAGAELKAARQLAGISRQKLAGLAGCSMAWVQQLEAGVQPADSPTLERIWMVLDALGGRSSGGSGGP